MFAALLKPGDILTSIENLIDSPYNDDVLEIVVPIRSGVEAALIRSAVLTIMSSFSWRHRE
jgi:hypothetical protein